MAEDRASCAEALVLETCEILLAWVYEQPLEWTWRDAGDALESGLGEWLSSHGWRAAPARLASALRRAGPWAESFGLPPRAVWSEELALWLASGDADEPECPWSGVPLESGRRIPSRSSLARLAAKSLARGETILVFGHSETVALALTAAQEGGLAPRVLLSPAGPFAEGRRMADRLSPSGMRIEMDHDAVLLRRVAEADRAWLGTEAIDAVGAVGAMGAARVEGAREFLALAGANLLCREALRADVPVELLATSDKDLPGGRVLLPAWCANETWLLWDDPPENVELHAQAYERVPLSHVRRRIAEVERPERFETGGTDSVRSSRRASGARRARA